MKLTLNIKKKHFYVLVTLMTLLIGIVAVNAYGTSQPTEFGHSGGELDVVIPGRGTMSIQQAIDDGVFDYDFNIHIERLDDRPYDAVVTCPVGMLRVGCAGSDNSGNRHGVSHGVIADDVNGCVSKAHRPNAPLVAICLEVTGGIR